MAPVKIKFISDTREFAATYTRPEDTYFTDCVEDVWQTAHAMARHFGTTVEVTKTAQSRVRKIAPVTF